MKIFWILLGLSSAAMAETVIVAPYSYSTYVNPNPPVFDKDFFNTTQPEYVEDRNGNRRYYGYDERKPKKPVDLNAPSTPQR